MTDRELLEMAAKAAGIYLAWQGDDFPVEVFERWNGNPNEPPEQVCRDWNPLTSDADAFRLAVDLGVSTHQNISQVGVSSITLALAGIFIKEECMKQDAWTATRRAITRAAAAIGEQK